MNDWSMSDICLLSLRDRGLHAEKLAVVVCIIAVEKERKETRASVAEISQYLDSLHARNSLDGWGWFNWGEPEERDAHLRDTQNPMFLTWERDSAHTSLRASNGFIVSPVPSPPDMPAAERISDVKHFIANEKLNMRQYAKWLSFGSRFCHPSWLQEFRVRLRNFESCQVSLEELKKSKRKGKRELSSSKNSNSSAPPRQAGMTEDLSFARVEIWPDSMETGANRSEYRKYAKHVKIIAAYSSEDSSGKTTSIHSLGWKLAEKNHRVMIVDSDFRGRLTELALNYTIDKKFHGNLATFFDDFPPNVPKNLFEALLPMVKSQQLIVPAVLTRLDNFQTGALFLLPSSKRLQDLEAFLSCKDTELSQSALNSFGVFYHVLLMTAQHYNIGYVLVDTCLGNGAFQKTLLMSCTHFLVPCSLTSRSVASFHDMRLASDLPFENDGYLYPELQSFHTNWHAWRRAKRAAGVRAQCRLLLPKKSPTFLGAFVTSFRPRIAKDVRDFAAEHLEWVAVLCKAVTAFAASLPQSMRINYPDDLRQKNLILTFVEEYERLLEMCYRKSKPACNLKLEDLRATDMYGASKLIGKQLLPSYVRKILRVQEDFERLSSYVVGLSKIQPAESDPMPEYVEAEIILPQPLVETPAPKKKKRKFVNYAAYFEGGSDDEVDEAVDENFEDVDEIFDEDVDEEDPENDMDDDE